MYTSNALIRAYMKKSAINHIDELTGEINTTALAEDAADKFNLYDSNDNIPEYVFDIAYEVTA